MTELHDRPVHLSDLDEVDPDDFSSNPSTAPSFADVVEARLSRRTVLRGAMLAAAGFMTTKLYADTPAAYASAARCWPRPSSAPASPRSG